MWTIKPLSVATLTLTRAAAISKVGIAADPGEILKVPDVAWLLTEEETGKRILVDTGPSEDPERDSQFHSPVEKTREQQLDYVLRKESVEPESIDTVILTHLHWDHGYGVYKLPNAKVYIQRDELQYAVAPFKVHRGAYELNDTGKPPYFFQYFHQLRIVDGDTKFCDGIELIKLPGHSPGSQGILVQTRYGQYLITGDLYYNMDNYNEDIPTGVYTSLYDYYASFAKVKNLGDNVTLLCGHDDNVFNILKGFR
jgi:N-acyl homoserine lactone hydrolase